MLAFVSSLITFLQVFQSHSLWSLLHFFVAAATSQLEIVAASPAHSIFPQTRTQRQLNSMHSQNQTQQRWVLYGLVPEAVWQRRKFFCKPMLCWLSCILYSYSKSISSTSSFTSTTPVDCCSFVHWTLTVDLWPGTKLRNVNLNNCEMKKKVSHIVAMTDGQVLSRKMVSSPIKNNNNNKIFEQMSSRPWEKRRPKTHVMKLWKKGPALQVSDSGKAVIDEAFVFISLT